MQPPERVPPLRRRLHEVDVDGVPVGLVVEGMHERVGRLISTGPEHYGVPWVDVRRVDEGWKALEVTAPGDVP